MKYTLARTGCIAYKQHMETNTSVIDEFDAEEELFKCDECGEWNKGRETDIRCDRCEVECSKCDRWNGPFCLCRY